MENKGFDEFNNDISPSMNKRGQSEVPYDEKFDEKDGVRDLLSVVRSTRN